MWQSHRLRAAFGALSACPVAQQIVAAVGRTIKCTRPTLVPLFGSAALRGKAGVPPLNSDVRRLLSPER